MKSVAFLVASLALVSAKWIRWEEREIDCGDPRNHKDCSPLTHDASDFPCQRRTLDEWAEDGWDLFNNTLLMENGRFRPDMSVSICPLDCYNSPHTHRLSVTVKNPYTNSNCSKYYSYGYIRRDDWFMWIADFCHSKLKIWCPFEVHV